MSGDFVSQSGIWLGKWVSDQRKSKNLLTEEQIASLESIGMNWLSKPEQLWREFYEDARAYYKEHGTLEKIPDSYIGSNGKKLAPWVRAQRVKHSEGKLSDEHVSMMEELNVSWPLKDMWMQSYERARIYYKNNGNLEVPNRYVDETGLRLGQWVAKNRRKKNDLSIERIKLLNEIGMQWQTQIGRAWEEKFQRAKSYYDEHGTIERIATKGKAEEIKAMRDWIHEQKRDRNIKRLSEEQKKKLRSIGLKID